MDKLFIRDLSIDCIIGTRPEERTRPQEIIINVEIECELSRAGQSDDLEDTVNYSNLRDRIVAAAADGEYFLIEKLADVISRICIDDSLVTGVTVTIDKPGALESARSAAVRIYRNRSG